MEREVLVLIATIVWTLEYVLPWMLGAFIVLLLIGAAFFVGWLLERRR